MPLKVHTLISANTCVLKLLSIDLAMKKKTAQSRESKLKNLNGWVIAH